MQLALQVCGYTSFVFTQQCVCLVHTSRLSIQFLPIILARHDHMPMQRSVGHQDHQNPQDTSGKGPQSRANYERLDNYYSNTGQNSGTWL